MHSIRNWIAVLRYIDPNNLLSVFVISGTFQLDSTSGLLFFAVLLRIVSRNLWYFPLFYYELWPAWRHHRKTLLFSILPKARLSSVKKGFLSFFPSVDELTREFHFLGSMSPSSVYLKASISKFKFSFFQV